MGLREGDTTQGSAEDVRGPGLRMLESRDLAPDAVPALEDVGCAGVWDVWRPIAIDVHVENESGDDCATSPSAVELPKPAPSWGSAGAISCRNAHRPAAGSHW